MRREMEEGIKVMQVVKGTHLVVLHDGSGLSFRGHIQACPRVQRKILAPLLVRALTHRSQSRAPGRAGREQNKSRAKQVSQPLP